MRLKYALPLAAMALLMLPGARIKQLAVEPAYSDDVTFKAFLAVESAKWRDVLKSRPAEK
jgi:hypothetical protein